MRRRIVETKIEERMRDKGEKGKGEGGKGWREKSESSQEEIFHTGQINVSFLVGNE